MARTKPKTEPATLPTAWGVMVATLSGDTPPDLPAIAGRVHKAKPRAVAPLSSMVPRRLAAGCGSGWKRERP